MGDTNLKSQSVLRYLGINLDQSLNFLQHLRMKRDEIICTNQNLMKFASKVGGIDKEILKTWYKLILEKRITYAAGTWYHRVPKSLGSKFVKSIQLQCLYTISGAYRKTSAASLCVLTGIMPLELQLEQDSIQGRVLRLGVPVHEHQEDPILYQPRLNKHHIRSDLNTIELVDEKELQLMKRDLDVYTDGSRGPEGTGFSFCVFEKDTEIFSRGVKLLLDNTVYQAELLAILESIRWCLSTNYRVFVIHSDCQSGLTAILDQDSKNFITIEIVKLLQSSTKTFYFRWIRGHTGDRGNERADLIAKQAAKMCDLAKMKFHPLSHSSLKRKLNQYFLEQWQRSWDEEIISRYTYQLIPKISLDRLFKHRNLYLFITNHGPFGKYLSLFKQNVTGFCACGGEADSLHYILECDLTERFHLRPPPPGFPLSSWFSIIATKPILLQKIINCVDYVDRNEFALQGV